MKIVEGGGFRLLTDDPVMMAVIRRCDELEERALTAERELRERAHLEVARFRTLRQDVKHISRAIRSFSEPETPA